MARSFYRVAPGNTPDQASYYHAASERHFTISRNNDRYLMRRSMRDDDGSIINVLEKSIDYVLGSGNHARSYISRAADGRLIALPLAWYAEKGGYWAMAPGYDRPDHADLRREIGSDCMFCHNGYPEKQTVAEGIDCQRCHGPGDAHANAARRGATVDKIRSTIVNPKRLSQERQLEVCFQCHLQSTSRRLPYAVRRYDRGVFSYRAGEPLADYMLHFDLAPDAIRSKTFEVVSAGSQFLQSTCYKASAGKLTCTTCHNPHDTASGSHYVAACRQCHQDPRHKQAVSPDCIACHMPKRRTDDAVHVIMTEHLIRRQPATTDLLALKQEVHETDEHSYLGRVVPLYPNDPDELYLALAQVRESANLADGIVRLKSALERWNPKEPGFYYEMGEALRNSGRPRQAIGYYQQARDLMPVARGLASAYLAAGETERAITILENAASDVESLKALGTAYYQSGKFKDAVAALRRAIAANSDLPEPHLNLGAGLASLGDIDGGMAAFREAIRLRPDLAAAHNNLAILLDRKQQTPQARRYFERAIRLSPTYADARHNLGMHLARHGEWQQAREHLLEAVKLQPSSEPVRLSLARTLIAMGKHGEALPHVRMLEKSNVVEIRTAAGELLKMIDPP